MKSFKEYLQERMTDAEHDDLREMISNIVKEILNERR